MFKWPETKKEMVLFYSCWALVIGMILFLAAAIPFFLFWRIASLLILAAGVFETAREILIFSREWNKIKISKTNKNINALNNPTVFAPFLVGWLVGSFFYMVASGPGILAWLLLAGFIAVWILLVLVLRRDIKIRKLSLAISDIIQNGELKKDFVDHIFRTAQVDASRCVETKAETAERLEVRVFRTMLNPSQRKIIALLAIDAATNQRKVAWALDVLVDWVGK